MSRNGRSEEMENVELWLLRCTGMSEEREKLSDNEGKGGVTEYGG